MASLVIVLLSKFIGSTFKNALDRLTAVVLANVVGQTGWVLVGWCTESSRIATALTVFLIVMPNMYVAYAGGNYSALGTRLAAIGAMSLLAPCSDDYLTHTQYANQYHAICDVVIGASIMLMVDMIFGGRPASALAKKALMQAIADLQKVFRDKFKSDEPQVAKELMDRLEKVQAGLDNVMSLSEDATKEPRFWRQPWRPALFQAISRGFLQINKLVQLLITDIRDDSTSCKDLHTWLNQQESWVKMVAKVDEYLEFTIDLTLYIIHMNTPSETVGLSLVDSHSDDDALPMDALITELNAKSKLKVDTDKNTLSNLLSTAVETLFSMSKQMRRIRHQVILLKSS